MLFFFYLLYKAFDIVIYTGLKVKLLIMNVNCLLHADDIVISIILSHRVHARLVELEKYYFRKLK